MPKLYLSALLSLIFFSSYASGKDTLSRKNPDFMDWNGQFSVAYGFPSILSFVVKYEGVSNVYSNTGFGPLHGKAEVTYKKRIGLAASLFYNTMDIKFRRDIDTNYYNVNDIGLNGRLNLYAINTPTHQLFLGYGMGATTFDNKMYNIYNGDTVVVATLLKKFDRTTSEATIGYRFYPRRQHFAFMTELGIGRTINYLREFGAIDSFIQFGVTYRISNKKQNDLFNVFKW